MQFSRGIFCLLAFAVSLEAQDLGIRELVQRNYDLALGASHCPIMLNREDFGMDGLVLNEPGYYIICDDIEFDNGSVTGITIASDYVTLNMNERAIYGDGLFNGIVIAPGYKNITIFDGILSDFIGNGILFGDDCHSIALNNVRFTETVCDSVIKASSVSNCVFLGCSITKCQSWKIEPCATTVCMAHCQDITMSECVFDDNSADDDAQKYIVLCFDSCADCRFVNCHCNHNSMKHGSLCLLGTMMDSENNTCQVEQCMFNDNYIEDQGGSLSCISLLSSGSIVYNTIFASNVSNGIFNGIRLSGNGNTVQSCTINDNQVLATENQNNSAGIHLLNGASNNISSNSVIGNIQCMGILLDSENRTSVVDTSIDGNGFDGLYLLNCQFCTVRNCSALGNLGTGINNQGSCSIITGCVSGDNWTNYQSVLAIPLNPTGATTARSVGQFDNVEFTNPL